jgi:hypothetical protein
VTISITAISDSLTLLLGPPTVDGTRSTWTKDNVSSSKLLGSDVDGSFEGLAGSQSEALSALSTLTSAVVDSPIGSVVLDSAAGTLSIQFVLPDIAVALGALGVTLHAPSVTLEWTIGASYLPSAATLATGQVTFQGIALELEASIELPSLLLSASLGFGAPSGGDLLSLAPLPAISDSGTAPSLASFSLVANLSVPRAIVRLSVANLIQIGSLVVRDAEVEVAFAQVESLTSDPTTEIAVRTQIVIELSYDVGPEDVRVLALVAKAERDENGAISLAGGLLPDESVMLGDVVRALTHAFSASKPTQLPGFLDQVELTSLWLSYDSASSASTFSFECSVVIELGEQIGALALSVSVHLTKGAQGYERSFAGVVQLGPYTFEVDFVSTGSSSALSVSTLELLVASFKNAQPLELGALAAGLPGIGALLAGTSLSLDAAVFAALRASEGSNQGPWRYFAGVGLDFDFSLDLSTLPVVGKLLPSDATFGINSLRFFLASATIYADETEHLPQTVRGVLAPMAAESPAANATARKLALDSGVNFRVELSLAGQSYVLPVPRGGQPGGEDTTPTTATTSTSSSTAASGSAGSAPAKQDDSISWIDVGCSFGPIHIARVGGGLQDEELWFAIDASLQASVLTIDIEGLAIGHSLTSSGAPDWRVRGMSLSYDSPPVTLSGGFIASADMKSFAGEAQLRAEMFELAAVGMYQDLGDYRSAFVFAMLEAPLGGPIMFYVTGLAAGFGYNSRVRLPPISGVRSHMLVQAALPGPSNPLQGQASDPGQVLATLMKGTSVTADPGENWFAAGVRFKSFDVINSFALLIVEFGNELEIAVLGVSSISLPPPPPETDSAPDAFVYIEMALDVVIQPARGIFRAEALITPASFLLSPNCVPTGGFAFYAWYGPSPNAGDFVLTIGGYHPRFPVPAHYPRVPRLGFVWSLGPLTIRGESYFALTPSAVMAGGRLEALFSAGPIRAWFIAMMDALIEWAPLHFDLFIGIEIGVSLRIHFLFVSITITITIGATIEIWGPPIGGKATVDLGIFSFSIPFGSSTVDKPKPLPWINADGSGFAQTLLPNTRGTSGSQSSSTVSSDAVLTITLTGGVVSTFQNEGIEVTIVRPDDLRFTASSAIPVTAVVAKSPGTGGVEQSTTLIGAPSGLGGAVQVRPMQIVFEDTTLALRFVDVHTGTALEADRYFTGVALTGQVPAAKWGAPLDGELTPEQANESIAAWLGIQQTQAHAPPLTPSGDRLLSIPEAALGYDDITPASAPQVAAFGLGNGPTLTRATDRTTAMTTIANALASSAVSTARQGLLDALANYGLTPCDDATASADPYGGKPGLALGGAPLLA